MAARMFALSWLSYFSYYFTRKNFSVAKRALLAESGAGGISETELAWIDTTMLVGYVLGQFLFGVVADRRGPRVTVAVGMLATAATTMLFTQAHVFGGGMLAVYLFASGLGGLFQASGWPGNGRLMANWVASGMRGRVMGWWSTCYQAGGLVATLLAGWLVRVSDWRTMYGVMAGWVSVVAVAYARWVQDRPTVGPHDANRGARQSAGGVASLLRQPAVWAFGLCYFALKLMRYGFLFWLPYYLATARGYDDAEAAFAAVMFDLGGIPAAIAAGWLADRVFGGRRVLVAMLSAAGLIVALWAYRGYGAVSPGWNLAMLLGVGACLFGADTVVSGAVAQDVGGESNVALACGLINGMGSVGAVVQALVLIRLKQAYGWDAVFALFQWMAVLATVALAPFVRMRAAGVASGAGQTT